VRVSMLRQACQGPVSQVPPLPAVVRVMASMNSGQQRSSRSLWRAGTLLLRCRHGWHYSGNNCRLPMRARCGSTGQTERQAA
jgi:hypothetical protein